MQKPSLQEKERATATAKTISYATAKFDNIYGELVLKRWGLRGLLRLAFAKDLRSRFYICAGGKQQRQKTRAKRHHDLQKENYGYY